MKFETRDIPQAPRGITSTLLDWDELAREIKALADGKAKALPHLGKSKKMVSFSYLVRHNLKNRGISASCRAVNGELYVWERRNGASA